MARYLPPGCLMCLRFDDGYNLKHTVNGSGAECLWKLHIKSLFCGPIVCRLQGYSSRCRCKCSLLWLLLVYYFNTFEKERAGGGRVLEPVFWLWFCSPRCGASSTELNGVRVLRCLWIAVSFQESQSHGPLTLTLAVRLRYTRIYDADAKSHPERCQ